MAIDKLINEIIEKRKTFLESKIQRYPATVFRASDIHDCDRYMVHSILDWDKKQMHDAGLQAIFDRGNKEETEVQRDLLDLGYKVIESQTPFEIKNRAGDIICRGRIDGKIQSDKNYPIEVKSMNMNTFNSINSIEDLTKKPLHRKYLRQMQLYCFGHNAEEGLFILSNLQGHYKLIPVYLDLGECEWILQRLERNWDFVKKKEYPEAKYNDQLCSRCPYAHICLVDVTNKGVEFIDNSELELKLERRKEIEALADEYAELDKEIKQPYKDCEKSVDMFIGTNWRIFTKKTPTVRVDLKAIPDDIKKQYEVSGITTYTKIIDLRTLK